MLAAHGNAACAGTKLDITRLDRAEQGYVGVRKHVLACLCRVPVAVVLASADDGELGQTSRQQLWRSGDGGAVMADFEHVYVAEQPLAREGTRQVLFSIAREQDV